MQNMGQGEKSRSNGWERRLMAAPDDGAVTPQHHSVGGLILNQTCTHNVVSYWCVGGGGRGGEMGKQGTSLPGMQHTSFVFLLFLFLIFFLFFFFFFVQCGLNKLTVAMVMWQLNTHRTGLNSSNKQTRASKYFLLRIFETCQELQYEVVEGIGEKKSYSCFRFKKIKIKWHFLFVFVSFFVKIGYFQYMTVRGHKTYTCTIKEPTTGHIPDWKTSKL